MSDQEQSKTHADVRVSLDNRTDPHQIRADCFHPETKQIYATVYVTFAAGANPEAVYGCLKFALAHLDQLLHKVIIPVN